MFNAVKTIIMEQIQNKRLIYRMSRFEVRADYQSHYLGTLWQFLTPIIQIVIYWIVFGVGLRGGGSSIGELPYIIWLLMGLIPWFFISPSMIQGSNSIHQKVSLVSKMNFPVSLLPTIKILSNSVQFIVLMLIFVVVLIINGVGISLFWIQLFYYFFCMFMFIFAFSLFSSTISMLIRDYQTFLSSTMRMLLYLSPILWDPTGDRVPPLLTNLLQLNPLYYIIDGIRNSFLGTAWFFDDLVYTSYFWVFTITLLLIGAKLHIHFREDFVDYL
ncbi:teichoic acid translocation permease protein TagG [Gracilibacillus boraciitolerans JCM 21714]|uniref:Transport permease protein n=1 Tax=Gracilibacillus boraciitolerans JCM 21714 TaxID=1298598 RepID=W4VGY7_9BACI|nr:ABC transporter permease [Gracilibacillus boraciitolerans]GAE92462.1 teichoic acid translocation permease protein TagG [Gracilibacillus boraciitolerans JCM 21714]